MKPVYFYTIEFRVIAKRMKECKLDLNEQKTQIVYCRNHIHKEKYEQVSFDFLGYTFRPRYSPTKKGLSLLFTHA